MKDPLVKRLFGAALLLAAALLWNPTNPLWLAVFTWVAFALGAYLVTGALFALFLSVASVTSIHLALYDMPPDIATVYTVTAWLSGGGCLVTLALRFKARIEATREERWKHR